jgi:hypothetical protein
MASAHALPIALDRCLREGFFTTRDPGDAGTFDISLKGKAICAVTTAGAETRALPPAAGYGIGTELLVYANHLVGAATITGADTGSVVLSSDGDHTEFVVVGDDQVRQWNTRGISVVDGVTAAVAFGTDNVLIRSDGTGRGTQLSGVVLDDADQFTSKLGFLTGLGAAASASGLIMGGGTSLAPLLTAAANANFIEFRAKSTGTGAQRLMYLRYDAAGAGTYECVRGLLVLTAEAANARGGSFSLVASDTGYITGSGSAVHARLEIADAAVPANGTYYGALVDLFGDGASSSLAAVTKYAILGIAATGHATFIDTVKNAIAFDGGSGAGNMIVAGTTLGTAGGSIRILVNGVVKYLPFYAAEASA